MVTRTNFGRLARAGSLLLASLILAHKTSANAPQEEPEACLRLGADESLADFYHLFEDLVADVYRQAGFCAVSIPASPKRIEQMVLAGTLDGDWLRVEGYAGKFLPQLIEVPTPLFQMEAKLISLTSEGFNGNPEDLKGRRVGYTAGFRWLERNLPLVGAIPVELPAGAPAKPLLVRGRLDVFATDGVRIRMIEDTFTEGDPSYRVDSWQKISFYHLVHEKHADKIDALAKAFKHSIAAGKFEKVFALPGLARANDD